MNPYILEDLTQKMLHLSTTAYEEVMDKRGKEKKKSRSV
jgi:hypothetical protein